MIPIDCKLSTWAEWGPCDRTCGHAQTRPDLVMASHHFPGSPMQDYASMRVKATTQKHPKALDREPSRCLFLDRRQRQIEQFAKNGGVAAQLQKRLKACYTTLKSK